MENSNKDGLPETFDLLIIGTGLSESIISAAASRNGHSVLHIDPRDYYGSLFATFNLETLFSKTFAQNPLNTSLGSGGGDEKSFQSDSKISLEWRNSFHGIEDVWYVVDPAVKESLLKNGRRCNIDLQPKVIMARDEIIEILIKSNVSRYLEFLRVNKMFTKLPDLECIKAIPLSRSDIFNSKSIKLTEKRMLSKFIEAVMTSGDDESSSKISPTSSNKSDDEGTNSNPPTLSQLQDRFKLPDNLKHLIVSSVETVEDGFENSSSVCFDKEFVPRCRSFLQSIGRFGNQTPYLWPLYGVSELCQAFCRLSAVYGGIFILNRFLSACTQTDDCFSVKSGDDKFQVKNIVYGSEFQRHSSCNVRKFLGRGIIITNEKPIIVDNQSEEQKGNNVAIYKFGSMEVIEMNSSSQAVPKEFGLLQVSVPLLNSTDSPRNLIESQLSPYVNFTGANPSPEDENVSDSCIQKPLAIYSSFYVMDIYESEREPAVSNIYSCHVHSCELKSCLEKSKEIFGKIFPDEEFLPKAPDMEETQVEEDAEIDEEMVCEAEDGVTPPTETPS